MTNSYIKYTDEIEFKPRWAIAKIIEKLLSRFISKPNPDFDDEYVQVNYWFLEIEPEYGLANREIGFSTEGKPMVFGPFNTNRGLWIDSPVKFKPEDFENVTKDEFEKHWQELVNIYK